MIIYLEGVDGSGKSTLASKIAEDLKSKGYNVMQNAEALIPTHPARPGRLSEETLYDQLEYMASHKEKIYIVDRGPISDCIYRVFDDYKAVTNLNRFFEFMEDYEEDIICIYCKSEGAEKNMIIRGDDNPVAVAKHEELSKIYDMIMSIISPIYDNNFLVYDYEKTILNAFILNINYIVFNTQICMKPKGEKE